MAENISNNLKKITERLQAACTSHKRDVNSVRLIAVSKTKPVQAILEALDAGQIDFGENYVQEALDKQQALRDLALEWHFIGPIQSNKTRPIAENFSWVHSLDRLKIAERLSAQRPVTLAPLAVCLQVRLGDEATKSGATPADLPALADHTTAYWIALNTSAFMSSATSA